MTKPELHVVEGGKMDKSQALAAALAQIDKLYGKGSIMRLGANDKIDVEVDLDRLARSRYRARHRRPSQGPRH